MNCLWGILEGLIFGITLWTPKFKDKFSFHVFHLVTVSHSSPKGIEGCSSPFRAQRQGSACNGHSVKWGCRPNPTLSPHSQLKSHCRSASDSGQKAQGEEKKLRCVKQEPSIKGEKRRWGYTAYMNMSKEPYRHLAHSRGQ